ncbi:hypothetical protein BC628DRAFT_1398590 [Trametes gibbosa]|nr:hypothetical protein BC628DRAFT_1202159 [Trametes gibbosa]KAI0820201.1 hypothetical protein BC628DRAFT_1398590 [Trametes gibbosa]
MREGHARTRERGSCRPPQHYCPPDQAAGHACAGALDMCMRVCAGVTIGRHDGVGTQTYVHMRTRGELAEERVEHHSAPDGGATERRAESVLAVLVDQEHAAVRFRAHRPSSVTPSTAPASISPAARIHTANPLPRRVRATIPRDVRVIECAGRVNESFDGAGAVTV